MTCEDFLSFLQTLDPKTVHFLNVEKFLIYLTSKKTTASPQTINEIVSYFNVNMDNMNVPLINIKNRFYFF